MRKMVSNILIITCIFIMVFVAVMLWAVSSSTYIKGKIDFRCLRLPRERYSFDAIGYGKDFDALHIYTLSYIDQHRFKKYVANHDQWKPLPLDDAVLTSRISNVKYHPYMNEMLNVRIGYWFFKNEHELYIYDSSTGMLYIRTASCVTDYCWESE